MSAGARDHNHARPRRGSCTPSSAPRPTIGRRLPDLTLPSSPEGDFPLGVFARRFSLVICLYPAIGTPLASKQDYERARSWTKYDPILAAAGHRLVAISSDDPREQHEWLEVEAPPYLVLCDQHRALARELNLETIRRAGKRVYAPVTLVVRGQRIVHMARPVPSTDAANTTRWIAQHL